MEGTGKILKVPDVEVIIDINRMFIEASGEEFIGNDNLVYRTSLGYILEAVQHSSFGEDLFPSIFHKAAAIAERIIVNHIFFGANKRTGLLTCVMFLELNGYIMQIYDAERFDREAIETALAFQEKQITQDDFIGWIKSRSVLVAEMSDQKPHGVMEFSAITPPGRSATEIDAEVEASRAEWE